MKYISLDIETVPLEITQEDVKTYLMDKKISKERRSLDPNYCKIIVVGVKKRGEPARIFFDDDEKQLLQEVWGFLRANKDNMIVTHNGYKFDIPFMIVRSCVNNVELPFNINVNQWQMEKSNHFDTMVFFSQYGNFTNPNLDVLCRMHGIEVPSKRLMGVDIERLFKEGNLDIIKEHCKQDIEILEKLFEKSCLNYLRRLRT